MRLKGHSSKEASQSLDNQPAVSPSLTRTRNNASYNCVTRDEYTVFEVLWKAQQYWSMSVKPTSTPPLHRLSQLRQAQPNPCRTCKAESPNTAARKDMKRELRADSSQPAASPAGCPDGSMCSLPSLSTAPVTLHRYTPQGAFRDGARVPADKQSSSTQRKQATITNV